MLSPIRVFWRALVLFAELTVLFEHGWYFYFSATMRLLFNQCSLNTRSPSPTISIYFLLNASRRMFISMAELGLNQFVLEHPGLLSCWANGSYPTTSDLRSYPMSPWCCCGWVSYRLHAVTHVVASIQNGWGLLWWDHILDQLGSCVFTLQTFVLIPKYACHHKLVYRIQKRYMRSTSLWDFSEIKIQAFPTLLPSVSSWFSFLCIQAILVTFKHSVWPSIVDCSQLLPNPSWALPHTSVGSILINKKNWRPTYLPVCNHRPRTGMVRPVFLYACPPYCAQRWHLKIVLKSVLTDQIRVSTSCLSDNKLHFGSCPYLWWIR